MVVERDPKKVDFTKDNKIRLFPDDPFSDENQKEYLAREESKFFDPCKEASKMSMSCLDRNNYDRTKCTKYFEIYRDCMREWKKHRK
ncbi:Cox23 protein [Starmerella bacillaris]|uniref:Cytochrome c oxidase-assembly factor COX23, mitochondrial n=1 Tax=Starmerella bacillaris TaxID=1247836 RepID=A0AAV5RK80_STABA|nr:Cox23 protein [Starmerella bacillaris]